MKKPVLYLETSLFGFYFDEEPRNATKRESIITLFDEIQPKFCNSKIYPSDSPDVLGLG